MKKTIMVISKFILLLLFTFLFVNNFGCRNENSIEPQINESNKDGSSTDGHVHGQLKIYQIMDDGTKEILNTGDVWCIGGESYDSDIQPFSTECVNPSDFEVIYSGWWSLNPLSYQNHRVSFEIYNTHWHEPQIMGTYGFTTTGSSGNCSLNVGNDPSLTPCMQDLGWRIMITPLQDNVISSK